MTLAPSIDAAGIREEIFMAERSYENYLVTGETTGMSPHAMRDYIEVRENEIRSL